MSSAKWRSELLSAEEKLEKKDETIASIRSSMDKLRDRNAQLQKQLAEVRRSGNERIEVLKIKLLQTRQTLDARNTELKSQLLQAREAFDARNAELRTLLAEARKNSAGVDTRAIMPLEHNSKESMDAHFADIIDEKPYLILARGVVSMLQKHNVVLDGKSVLDIGIGPGIVLKAILSEYKPTSISGNDFSDAAIKQASERIPEGRFAVHNIYDPQPTNADVVFNTEVLEHLEKPSEALKNILGAVAPGGVAVITAPDGRVDNSRYHINFWSPESWRIFVSSCADGFDCVFDEFQTRDDVRSRNNFALLKRVS